MNTHSTVVRHIPLDLPISLAVIAATSNAHKTKPRNCSIFFFVGGGFGRRVYSSRLCILVALCKKQDFSSLSPLLSLSVTALFALASYTPLRDCAPPPDSAKTVRKGYSRLLQLSASFAASLQLRKRLRLFSPASSLAVVCSQGRPGLERGSNSQMARCCARRKALLGILPLFEASCVHVIHRPAPFS